MFIKYDLLLLTVVYVKKLTWEESQQILMRRAKKCNEYGSTTASENLGVQADAVEPDPLTIILEMLRKDEPFSGDSIANQCGRCDGI